MLTDKTVIKTFKVLVTIVLFAGSLLLLYRLRTVISWLLIGAFLAIVINPAVGWLTRRLPGERRAVSVAVILVTGFLLISGLVAMFAPTVIKQVTSLVTNWPEISDSIVSQIETSNEQPYKFMRNSGVIEYLQNNREQISQNITAFFAVSVQKVGSLLGSIGAMVTILAMAVYTSVNAPQYAKSVRRRVPRLYRDDFDDLVSKMYGAVTGYVNGNLLVSLAAGLATTAIAMIIGLPYPALLGLIVGVTDLIPMVGAMLGAVIVTVIAMFSSIPDALVMAIFFTVYQQFENYILAPRIMGRTVEMSSFAVFVAALAGGVLAGFIGALVAIPIGACLQILFRYLVGGKQATQEV